MRYTWDTWLADEFRAAGLTVHEVTGWKTRGRPASTGAHDCQGPVTIHHTGTHTSPTNPHPTLTTLIQGRSDLPGPLCSYSVDHNGDVWVIAAGRANHAGRIDRGMPGMPQGADGNAYAHGNEVDTDGTQGLSPAQVHTIAVTNAVILAHHKREATMIHRHADIAPNRKWDIGSRSTADLRRDAAAAGTTPAPTDWLDMATEAQVTSIVREQIAAAIPAIAKAVLDSPVENLDADGKKVSTGTLGGMLSRVDKDIDVLVRELRAAVAAGKSAGAQ